MRKEFNYVDVAFVVDTTGSMGPFLEEAKKRLIDALERLSSKNDIDLRVGLVQYKDHPPQDSSFVTKHLDFSSKMNDMRNAIKALSPSGGGDTPEAVYQGLYDACEKLHWRPNSSRFILLVGDAPPHAFPAWLKRMLPLKDVRSGGDAWPNACPSGLDVSKVTALAEKKGITIHTVCLAGCALTEDAFLALASGAGGRTASRLQSESVIDKIMAMLEEEFLQIGFDMNLYETIAKTKVFDCQKLAETVGSTKQKVASSVARLGRRGFLDSVN